MIYNTAEKNTWPGHGKTFILTRFPYFFFPPFYFFTLFGASWLLPTLPTPPAPPFLPPKNWLACQIWITNDCEPLFLLLSLYFIFSLSDFLSFSYSSFSFQLLTLSLVRFLRPCHTQHYKCPQWSSKLHDRQQQQFSRSRPSTGRCWFLFGGGSMRSGHQRRPSESFMINVQPTFLLSLFLSSPRLCLDWWQVSLPSAVLFFFPRQQFVFRRETIQWTWIFFRQAAGMLRRDVEIKSLFFFCLLFVYFLSTFCLLFIIFFSPLSPLLSFC